MVKHSDFLEHIASVFGEELTTFKTAYRLLREAGVALEGKRGRHAPERTPADAAALWCWAGISDKLVLAPNAVKDFGYSPRVGNVRSQETMREALGLPERHTLLEALAALIAAEADGKTLPGYTVEFQADELSVTIDCGSERYRYSRDQDDDAAVYQARYGRPYRLIRQFPQAFVREIATIFQQAENVASRAA